MKTTKQKIKENTKSTKVDSRNLGRYSNYWYQYLSNYWYQHDGDEAFELHHPHPVVMHHVGPNSYEIGGGTTKTEFIEVIYDFLTS